MSFENFWESFGWFQPFWVHRLLCCRAAACVLQPGRNASGQEKADKEGKERMRKLIIELFVIFIQLGKLKPDKVCRGR